MKFSYSEVFSFFHSFALNWKLVSLTFLSNIFNDAFEKDPVGYVKVWLPFEILIAEVETGSFPQILFLSSFSPRGTNRSLIWVSPFTPDYWLLLFAMLLLGVSFCFTNTFVAMTCHLFVFLNCNWLITLSFKKLLYIELSASVTIQLQFLSYTSWSLAACSSLSLKWAEENSILPFSSEKYRPFPDVMDR